MNDGPGGGSLTEAERAPLLRWQRRMRIALVASIALVAVYWAVILVAPDEPWVATLAIPFAAPLVLTGIAMQYTGRCPRCGFRIGLRSKLALPPECPRCGVRFGSD